MKQITQKEFIKLIEEKQENAKNAIEALGREQTWTIQEGQSNLLKKERNKAYIDAYQDLICHLNGVEIVPEHNDEIDALQYAVKWLNEYKPKENQNLVKVYFGKKVKVHTKKRIVGSKTPFEAEGKIGSDSGKFIDIQEDPGWHVFIDKDDIKSIEIVPENKLLETLCNKCSKTEEACPFHRMGSAYEDCGAFEEQIVTTIPKAKREELGITQDDLKKMVEKTPITPYVEPTVEPLRNDRFRDFKKSNDCNDFYISIDAKDVKTITMTYEKKYKTISIYVDDYCVKSVVNKIDEQEWLAFYKDLIEWRNYWKQN